MKNRFRPVIELLETREVPAGIWVGEPGMTRETAYQIGDFTSQLNNKPQTDIRVFNGSMETKSDVDLFAIDAKAGQSIKIRIDDTWNGNLGERASGLRVNINLYNSKGGVFGNWLHQSPNVTGYDLQFQASESDKYFIGVSAADNGRYNIIKGTGNVEVTKGTAIGGYTLKVQAQKYVLQPGVYVVGREIEGRAHGLATHQYVIAIPEQPKNFKGIRDLGYGIKGFVISADSKVINNNPYLFGGTFVNKGDIEFTKKIASLGTDKEEIQNFNYQRIDKVKVDQRVVDETIKSLLFAADVYSRNANNFPIPYNDAPTPYGPGFNSNSWTQSIIEYVVGRGKVKEDFPGFDWLNTNRINTRYFSSCLVSALY